MEEVVPSVEITSEVAEQPLVERVDEVTSKNINLAALRERAERAEARAAEFERMARQKEAQPEPDDDLGFEDDGLIEGKHLKQYHKKQKNNSKQTQQQIDAINNALSELRLRTKFPDIDDVVNDDNLDKLKRVKPALWRSIKANEDFVDRGEVAYDAISTWVAPKKHVDQDKKLEENKAKPRNAASVGASPSDTPLTRVGDFDRRILSPADKERIQRQVEEAKRYR